MFFYIKRILLKPIFNCIYSVSPACAVFIRNMIVNRFLFFEIKQSDGRPRLLVDVSIVTNSDAKTGIQRVVNSLSEQLLNKKNEHLEFTQLIRNKLVTSTKYLSKFKKNCDLEEKVVIENEGDTLFLLDSSWDRYKLAKKAAIRIHEKNGKIYGIIHDLFPITYPELFDSQYFIDTFINWHNMLLENADGIICVSKNTADIVSEYYKKSNIKRNSPLNIYHFHLGVTYYEKYLINSENIRGIIKDFVCFGFVFLMVGTIEPRKGHLVVVEAIRKLVKQGEKVKLLIIGKNGWKNDDFKKYFTYCQREYKENFLWINDATDEELDWVYSSVKSLIAASKDEGFGLPLIEAADHGVPIICSDIAVFHEVAGEYATYFKPMDSNDLYNVLLTWLSDKKHPDSKKIRLFTWNESAQEILDIMNGKINPYQIL